MFLRCSKRLKDGKEHLYWSVVENRRLADQRIVQRHVLYLGEINGVQEAAWRKTVDLFGQDDDAPQQVTLFPDEHAPDALRADELPIVRIKLSQMSLRRPRQWGACCGNSSGLMLFGASACPLAARARVGIRCCSR